MIRTKGTARLGFFAALLALLIAPMAIGFQTAQAQGPTVATYYGITDAGATVGASIDGASCGETTANDAGQWLLSIDENGCDGAATDGATVSFSLNGAEAEQTETWSKGGGPADTVNGVTLTVAAMPEPTAEPTEEAMPEPTEEAMPEPTEEAMPVEPETGNAGLVTSESSSPLIALALGILMVGGIAGARASTRRVS